MRISSYALRLEAQIKRIDADITEERKKESEAHERLVDLQHKRNRLATNLSLHLKYAKKENAA